MDIQSSKDTCLTSRLRIHQILNIVQMHLLRTTLCLMKPPYPDASLSKTKDDEKNIVTHRCHAMQYPSLRCAGGVPMMLPDAVFRCLDSIDLCCETA